MSTLRLRFVEDWAEEFNFAGPRVKTSLVSWVLLLAGVCLLVATVGEWDEVQGEKQLALANLKRLQRAQRGMALTQKAVALAGRGNRMSGPSAVLSKDGYRQAAQLAQKFGFDWAAVWQGIEEQPSEDQVLVTGFSVNLAPLASREGASMPDVLIHAMVKDDDAALRWVSHMGAGAQLRIRETLPAPLSTPNGTYAYKVNLMIANPGLQAGRP